MLPRLIACAALGLCLSALGLAGESFTLREDFSAYERGADASPAWTTTSITWEVADGAYTAASIGRGFAFPARAPHAKRVVLEATIRPSKAEGTDWKIAGLALVTDERNYWHFAFVEGPDRENRRHFVELSQMLDNTWLAEHAASTRLTQTKSAGSSFDWQYGHPYRMRLELTPDGIRGALTDLDGTVRADLAYRFDNRAVTTGRPALTGSGLQVTFDDIALTCQEPAPAPREETPAIPPYDRAGRTPLPDHPGARATGFFHVEEREGTWWVIDPRGKRFFITGTDHASYKGHWCEKLGYAPYGRNVQKLFGSEEKWAASTAERLLAWGFNAVGAGHSPSLRDRRLAWMMNLSMGASFSPVSDLVPRTTWTGFPNVFDPRFERYCDQLARKVCAPHKDNPWLLGYFIDNELEWYGKEHQLWSLVDAVFRKPAAHSGKQALVAFLRTRYPAVDALNEAWGTRVASYEALAASTEPLKHGTERGLADKMAFLDLVAERYFAVTTAAVRRHDPNHMILGCRFAGRMPPVGDVAGKYCDIFSINCYRSVDLETGEVRDFQADLAAWYAEVRRPFMITEWSFPALDSGLPCKHGAGQRFDTQQQKAAAFAIFQRLLFETPFMVGSNYFMWVDEPALGISSTFPEDSNYGLVDENDKPYDPLVSAATHLNPLACRLHAQEAVRIPPLPLVQADEAGGERPKWLGRPEAADLRLTRGKGTWSVENGVLTLGKDKPTGNAFDRVLLGGRELGRFVPVIWQNVGQDQWVQPETARLVNAEERKDAVVLEIEFERSPSSKQAVLTTVDEAGRAASVDRSPGGFRARYRFHVPRGLPWFGAQFLCIENTDPRPWDFQAYFHYALSNLDGSAADDSVGGPDVPNYYRRDQAVMWSDAKAGLHYGILAARRGDFLMHFWKDNGGGQHADVRREAKRRLEPGARWAEPQPVAWVFGLQGQGGYRSLGWYFATLQQR